MKFRIIVFSIMFLFSYTSVFGKYNLPVVKGDVWLVKTFGLWENDKAYGWYRVVVSRHPGEDASEDEVFVQIIKKDSKNEIKVINTIKLDTPDYKGYITNIESKEISKNKMILIFEIALKGMHGITQQEMYSISPDGEFKRILEAKYIDLE